MLKVLHLDDEADICEIFVDLFSSDSVLVKSVSNTEEALREVLENPPDLIFLDYRLPGITGEEVARKMNTQIAICLITGDLTLNTTYPFAAVFKKPWNTEEIQAFLDTFQQGK